MPTLADTAAWLDESLAELLAQHRIPGAAVAVLADGEVTDHAAGVLNTGTGVDSTVDSLFQIGSISKVWTATLAMQLVDEGLLGLDDPVRAHLPGFTVGDEQAAAGITVRQLMCHTAGFEGDVFTDTGPGDDAVERLVASLSDVPQLFPPGERFSYNNAGFCVLGRIIEVLRGKCWDDCVREHLIAPLGLTHAAAGPYDAIRYRAAIGHVQPGLDAEPVPAPVWALPRSNAPAGSTLAMSPRELLTFVHRHLVADSGTPVLSPESALAMREPQVQAPDHGLMPDALGLGWLLYDWTGGPVFGHDGATIGQNAYLRVVPHRGVAVALSANGGRALHLYQEVMARVLHDLADVVVPPLPAPAAGPAPVEVARFVGEYTSMVTDTVVSGDDAGRLWIERTPKGILAEMGERPSKNELLPYRGETFVARIDPATGYYQPYTFVGDDGAGHAQFLYHGRADRRERS
ncbi:serine hydrolase [Amycolatopsis sp. 195334CR]|uniref:serine hydrolase domain-containing protein n=1 Tax=Amycolatopsis sp. 195334CR TaxID=2814588 RepID=UPI001A8CEC08|nr:serine hydrolase domain-containing protein [Amycolatopsis sp. 195334CR]MBN6038522.1 beta-lactamase family protein [Amycolatopsis sp. 195334CR]